MALALAFRWLGLRGAILVTALALAGWLSILLADHSGRYHAAAWPVRVDLAIAILAISILPCVAVHRVQTRSGSYLRQVVYGLGGFYIAVLGTLLVGVFLFLLQRFTGR